MDTSKVLTLDFCQNHVAKKPLALAGSGFKLEKMKQGTNNELFYLLMKNYKANMPWYNFNDELMVRCRSKLCWYSCRIGMDPSIIGYENTVEYQSKLIYKLLDEFTSELKYLALVYEWGTNGKLHWHLLISLSGIRKFRKSAMAIFGYRMAVYCKKVEPNNGESFQQNIKQIIKYYQKEEQNKESCFLTRNV